MIEGEGRFAGRKPSQNQGDLARVANTGSEALSFLLIAGEPIGEPVARYGPFVMNSKEEILQAAEDFRAGKMGVLA